MGPTASGKTDLAVELVERLPCDIISVDSALVYQGMDIGTAKPDAATLAKAPHRLINFLDPAESYSAADFRQDALREMKAISEAGRIPLLVGGTMLYFNVLRTGMAEMPAADPAVRARLEQQADEQGWAALYEKLQQVDPVAAEKIHPNNPQRLLRALEVYEQSGQPISDFWQQQSAADLPYAVHAFAVAPQDRSVLHERIALRFQLMLEQGFVDEVKALYQRGDLHPDLPAIRAVGYRQVWAHLAGELSYDAMVDKAVVASRQLAKRQLTWLRKWPAICTGWTHRAGRIYAISY